MLVKGGVPEQRAVNMDRIERLAWLVTLGRTEGGTWDWESMEWVRSDDE